MGGESWHAIIKLFNPRFLILKIRPPAVTKVFEVYCIGIVGEVVVMISNATAPYLASRFQSANITFKYQ